MVSGIEELVITGTETATELVGSPSEKKGRIKSKKLMEITNFKRFKRDGSTSTFKGVFFVKKEQKYRAQICLKGKKKYVGTFKSDVEAAKARDDRVREMFGEVKELLNFPCDDVSDNSKSYNDLCFPDDEDHVTGNNTKNNKKKAMNKRKADDVVSKKKSSSSSSSPKNSNKPKLKLRMTDASDPENEHHIPAFFNLAMAASQQHQNLSEANIPFGVGGMANQFQNTHRLVRNGTSFENNFHQTFPQAASRFSTLNRHGSSSSTLTFPLNNLPFNLNPRQNLNMNMNMNLMNVNINVPTPAIDNNNDDNIPKLNENDVDPNQQPQFMPMLNNYSYNNLGTFPFPDFTISSSANNAYNTTASNQHAINNANNKSFLTRRFTSGESFSGFSTGFNGLAQLGDFQGFDPFIFGQNPQVGPGRSPLVHFSSSSSRDDPVIQNPIKKMKETKE